MTRILGALAAAFVASACAFSPLQAGAQPMTHANSTASPTIQQETTLNVSGEGRSVRTPDMATISLGVNVTKDTAKAAMDEQARIMNGIFKTLEDAGIADRDMQTGQINLSPQYDYSSRREGPPKVTGYQVSSNLNIRVRELNLLGAILDQTVSAGGNTINAVNFGLQDDTEAVAEARKAAVRDALEKAELYATAAGYKVARIITISEGHVSAPTPQPMMMARMAVSEDAMSTPIAAGETSLTAHVNVTFELTR